MISLEEYKEALINICHCEFDNKKEQKEKRMQYLNKYYSDSYLIKIINDTYKVIRNILNEDEPKYFNIKLGDEQRHYMSLNLMGGWFSDRLYIDSSSNVISEYILKKVFGKSLMVSFITEEYEFESSDSTIVSCGCEYFLYLQGFKTNVKEIKEELFGVSKVKKFR